MTVINGTGSSVFATAFRALGLQADNRTCIFGITLDYGLFYWWYLFMAGSRDSVVGIATRYGLEGPGSNAVGARFFAHIQTGSGAHPTSCTMDTGSFPGVKAAGA
jgi:hypothetical protein